jgi:sulfur carrier protein
MQVTINSLTETLDTEMTVADLLALRKLEPTRVAVEINEALVPRKTFSDTMVRDGDRIEIVTFVGGG